MSRPTLALLTLAAILGCNSTGPSDQTFNASRQKWLDANVTSYSMLVSRTDGSGEPVAVRVTVANGAVTERIFDGTGEPVPAGDASKYPDVEGLFALVQDAFDRAQTVNVTFNQTYGYPELTNINYNIGTLDDDLVVHVTEFVVP